MCVCVCVCVCVSSLPPSSLDRPSNLCLKQKFCHLDLQTPLSCIDLCTPGVSNGINYLMQGRFINGKKHGKGCFYFADGSTLSGCYHDDVLEGQGVYTYNDGSMMIAQYKNGMLDGKFTEYDSTGEITAVGEHTDDKRCGFLQVFEPDGSALVGVVNSNGSLSGTDITYLYPDRQTAIVGRFNEGVLVSGRYAASTSQLNYPLTDAPHLDLKSDYPHPVKFDESTQNLLSTQPLVPDAYEQQRVCVRPSLIPGAGQGLFARTNLLEGEVVSFYNGVRLTHTEVDARDWSANGNTISLDESTVIDVPTEFSSLSKYCASLGHKANHSQSPNCEYLPFSHPRFGEIKCISTLREVEKDEELTCDYGYDHVSAATGLDDLPDWFVEKSNGI